MTDKQRRRPLDDEFEMHSLRLDGRVALVTGSSRGLGLGMALALAHAGADVALAARTEEQLVQAAQLIKNTGQRAYISPTDAVFSDPVLYDSAVSVIPQGRPGIPADLAGATVLLASEASNYITGQIIVVDGGWLVNAGVKG